MSYSLFVIKNGDLVINKVEVLTIPSFTKILRRDKGSKGDSNGAKKLIAFKEFAYIFHVADIKSTPNRNGYDASKAHAYAIEKVGLEPDWKPDDVVEEAINDYKDEQENIATGTIIELLKIYSLKPLIYKKVRRSLEILINKDTLTVEEADAAFGLLDSLIKQGSTMLDITAKLTKSIKELELMDEQEQREKLRGTEEFVPNSADPDRQL